MAGGMGWAWLKFSYKLIEKNKETRLNNLLIAMKVGNVSWGKCGDTFRKGRL